jgi:hypothetical protein
MIDPTPVSRAQKLFIRAFRQNPAGPAPADWPTPGVLRRWLKSHRFKKALTATRDAIRLQTDFHLASAASSAARALQTTITPATNADLDPTALADLSRTLKSLTDLLRLAHLRERFTTPRGVEPKRAGSIIGNEENRSILARAHTTNGYEAILNDPVRLKGILMMAVKYRGAEIYDPFLSAFPEELAAAKTYYQEHFVKNHDAPPAQPTPDPTPPA